MTNMRHVRHISVFAGNAGTGKTRIARLVAEIFSMLGMSSHGEVIETQRSDLIATHVGQTAVKTRKVIDSARGGVLFVDEAYQLTDVLQRGGTDFGGEAVDEMMRSMLETGPNAVTFVLAGILTAMITSTRSMMVILMMTRTHEVK